MVGHFPGNGAESKEGKNKGGNQDRNSRVKTLKKHKNFSMVKEIMKIIKKVMIKVPIQIHQPSTQLRK